MDFLLDLNQVTTQNFFPVDGRLFQPVRQDVIDIFDINQITLEIAQILKQGPVTAGTKEKDSGIIPKRPVFQVNSQGIGGMILEGKSEL